MRCLLFDGEAAFERELNPDISDYRPINHFPVNGPINLFTKQSNQDSETVSARITIWRLSRGFYYISCNFLYMAYGNSH
jgi:hypothetical protein